MNAICSQDNMLALQQCSIWFSFDIEGFELHERILLESLTGCGNERARDVRHRVFHRHTKFGQQWQNAASRPSSSRSHFQDTKCSIKIINATDELFKETA